MEGCPENERTCPTCKGRGTASKYDLGWRSLYHSEELALQRTCVTCAGTGCVPMQRKEDY